MVPLYWKKVFNFIIKNRLDCVAGKNKSNARSIHDDGEECSFRS